MTKVLILAHDFPPCTSVGALRPYAWYNFFRENGIDPCVITRHWNSELKVQEDFHKASEVNEVTVEQTDQGEITRVPFVGDLRDRLIARYGMKKYAWVRRLLSFYYLITRHNFKWSDNLNQIYIEAEKKISQENFDLIIATAEPFILFKYAHQLSRRYGIPWAADYRDNWAYNPRRRASDLISESVWYMEKRLERKYLNSVDFVTVASPSYRMPISRVSSKEIGVIFNGYSDVDKGLQKKQSTEKFIIGYAGLIYPHQPIEKFFDVFAEVITDHFDLDFEIRFYGTGFYHPTVERIQKCTDGLRCRVTFLERMPYEDLRINLPESNLLLLLAEEGANWLNTKIFDYMASDRRIILFYDDKGILRELLQETNSGNWAGKQEELYQVLDSAIREFRSKGHVSSNPQNIEVYSRAYQTSKFCELIRSKTAKQCAAS